MRSIVILLAVTLAVVTANKDCRDKKVCIQFRTVPHMQMSKGAMMRPQHVKHEDECAEICLKYEGSQVCKSYSVLTWFGFGMCQIFSESDETAPVLPHPWVNVGVKKAKNSPPCSVEIYVHKGHNAGCQDAVCKIRSGSEGDGKDDFHDIMPAGKPQKLQSGHEYPYMIDFPHNTDFSSVVLECSSKLGDALYIAELVINDEDRTFIGVVNTVFDDLFCDTAAMKGIRDCPKPGVGKCCKKQATVAMKEI